VTLDEHEEDIVLEEAVVAERVVILDPLEEAGPVDRWTGEPDETTDADGSNDLPVDQSTGPPVNPDDHIKRPRRRRGRRGGRRNRPGGGGGGGGSGGPFGGPSDGTPPGGA
jgi:hypothetical protein